MKKRFCITKVGRDGFRTLALANQGRNHFDTWSAAQDHLDSIRRVNSEDKVRQFFYKARVDEVECYDNGDAIGDRGMFGDRIYRAQFKGRPLRRDENRLQRFDDVVGGDDEKDAEENLALRFYDITNLTLTEIKV